MTPSERRERFTLDASEAGRRLDVVVARRLRDASRAQAKRWIEQGRVQLDGEPARASRLCQAGQRVTVTLPPPAPATPAPEAIPLDVLFEDGDLVVVNKPAGMVVHPGPGHASGTLVNALLAHAKDLSGIGGVARPGIVHRLDAGTSGLIVVAKNDASHRDLARQFERREVDKRYLAIVFGWPASGLVIDRPIGRDPVHRTKISSRSARAREARTELELVERLPLAALVSVRIFTGRTHQIRVHLSEAGHPVVGDRDYGAPRRRAALPSRRAAAFRLLRDFPRPALHASRITLRHPRTGAETSWEAPLPEDMAGLLAELRRVDESAS